MCVRKHGTNLSLSLYLFFLHCDGFATCLFKAVLFVIWLHFEHKPRSRRLRYHTHTQHIEKVLPIKLQIFAEGSVAFKTDESSIRLDEVNNNEGVQTHQLTAVRHTVPIT